MKHLGTSAACTNRCDKDGSTQALQRQPRVLRYAIALQVHTPEKHGRFGLTRRFRLLQVNMFRVKLVLEQTPPVAIKTESARALATPKRGEFIGPSLPKGVGIPAHQMQHMHHDVATTQQFQLSACLTSV